MDKVVVAFDLYGTLLSTASIAKELASHFGEEKAQTVAAVWRRYQLEYTWRLNSMKKYVDFYDVTKNSLHNALAEHGLSLENDAIDDLMKAYDSLSTFPDAVPALKKLASHSSIECVVFSNGTSQMLENSVHKSSDLGPHSSVFKQIVSVDDIKVFKPAPEVYKHLASLTGMAEKLHLVWLVSGNPFDVIGARAVGMQAAWVDRAGNGWQDRLGGEPTIVVRSLEEVAGEIQQRAN